MTREEAVKELKIIREDYWDEYEDTMPALDMAIKALEQEPILDRLKEDIENEIRFWQEPSKYGDSDKRVREAKVTSYKHILELMESIKTLKQQPIIDVNVPHKIAEFFSNWGGDENAKMEISIDDMREISNMFVTKCRAESKLKALEQQPEDAINRQVAIDIVSHECGEWKGLAKEIVKQFNELPSVQPKYNTSEWCKTCSEYDQDKHCCPRYNKVIRNAVEEVKKPKTGHWILTDDDFVYCSECEDSYYPRPIDASWYYCPHCGAKMIEPQAESEGTDAGSN